MTMDEKETKTVVSSNKESTTEFRFWLNQALSFIIEYIVNDLPVGFIDFVLVEVDIDQRDTTRGVHVSQHPCNGVERNIEFCSNGCYGMSGIVRSTSGYELFHAIVHLVHEEPIALHLVAEAEQMLLAFILLNDFQGFRLQLDGIERASLGSLVFQSPVNNLVRCCAEQIDGIDAHEVEHQEERIDVLLLVRFDLHCPK